MITVMRRAARDRVQAHLPRLGAAKTRLQRPLSSSPSSSSDVPPKTEGPLTIIGSTIRYFVAGAAALSIPTALFGWIYQREADKRDWSILMSLAPGDFISAPMDSRGMSFFLRGQPQTTSTNVDQQGKCRSAHVVVRGEGAPLVVLEASTGGVTQDFGKCIDEIATFTTVIAYDRYGLGFSSEQEGPIAINTNSGQHARRNASRLRKELDQVLSSTPGLKDVHSQSVIVVGHGQGGAIALDLATECAANRSKSLAGVVLLDSACGVRNRQRSLSKDIATAIDGMVDGSQSVASLSKLGLARLMMNTQKSIDDLSQTYRPQDCGIVQALKSRTNHCQAVAEEVACYPDDDAVIESLLSSHKLSGETIAASESGPGGFRALVVSHGDAEMFRELAALGSSPEEAQNRLDELEDIWQNGQQKLAAALSRNSVLVQAKGCTHDIPGHHPHVVIDAVRAMVEAVRNDSNASLRDFHDKFHDKRGSRGTTLYHQRNRVSRR